MLNQETQDALSKLGLDVSKLVEAIKAEDEVTLEVPQAKDHTKEDLTVFGKNRFDEGKNAMSEIMAKSYKEKYGLDIEGKDLDNIVEAVKSKGFNEAKPDDNAVELQKNYKELQTRHSELEQSVLAKENEYKNSLFQVGIKQKLAALVPKGTALNNSDAVDLYLMRNQLKNNDGSAVIELNGEIVKDNLLNPILVEDHFKGWLDTSGLIGKKGMGGDDSKGGSSVSKFKTTAEFYAYAKDKGIEPMSEEGQKILVENKDADFVY